MRKIQYICAKIKKQIVKKEILVTNDDSIDAQGVKVLAQMLTKYGHVTVVAPAEPQSGKSTSLSMEKPLYLKKIKENDDMSVYSFSGTPADCIKIAMNTFFSLENKPDYILSGINHGTNATAAVIYSGTIGAVKEGTILEIPSMGFSIDNGEEEIDFTALKYYGDKILRKFFSKPPTPGTYLNVNFPNICDINRIKGIKIAHQGKGRWVREFTKMKDSHGQDYYWMKGNFQNLDDDYDRADHLLVDEGYIAIVPHKLDCTNYEEMNKLQNDWGLE